MSDKVDMVNHPSHYADHCSIECKDAMCVGFGNELYFNFCLMNAFKYIWRHKYKNGNEDLDKANWYLNEAETMNDDLELSELDMNRLYKLYQMVGDAKNNIEIEEEL